MRTSGMRLSRTLILGAGATAVSAILAARELGAERVTVLARRPQAAMSLAERFDGSGAGGPSAPSPLDEPRGSTTAEHSSFRVFGYGWADSESGESVRAEVAEATAVISTLPGDAGERIALPAGLNSVPLFDVAYDPWPSPLAERWKATGGEAHAGIDMLVEQALAQVRIFVGGDPAFSLTDEARLLATMRDAGVGG